VVCAMWVETETLQFGPSGERADNSPHDVLRMWLQMEQAGLRGYGRWIRCVNCVSNTARRETGAICVGAGMLPRTECSMAERAWCARRVFGSAS